MGGAGDYLVAAFGNDWHLLDGRYSLELIGQLVLFFERLQVSVLVLDVADSEDGQNRLRISVDIVAP